MRSKGEKASSRGEGDENGDVLQNDERIASAHELFLDWWLFLCMVSSPFLFLHITWNFLKTILLSEKFAIARSGLISLRLNLRCLIGGIGMTYFSILVLFSFHTRWLPVDFDASNAFFFFFSH